MKSLLNSKNNVVPQKANTSRGNLGIIVIVLFLIGIFLLAVPPYLVPYAYLINGQFTSHFPISVESGLQYVGGVISILIAIFAILVTLDENKRSIKLTLIENREMFDVNTQKTYLDKTYFEVCDMSKTIMVFLGLTNMHKRINEIKFTNTTANKKAEKIESILRDTIGELSDLSRTQWYYYTMLESAGFFDDGQNNDAVDAVKGYFTYIYYLLDTDKEEEKENCLAQQFSTAIKKAKYNIEVDEFTSYIRFITSLSTTYHERENTKNEPNRYNQYTIKEETERLLVNLKILLDERVKKGSFGSYTKREKSDQ